MARKANRNFQEIVKRSFDLCFTTLASLLLLPIAALASLAIRLTSGRPILYRAERVGRQGRPFLLYKFRTMVVNAHASGPGVTRQADPRIIPFGRMLRKTKFDEFPQVINVLRGEMSIVGPRPEAPEYIRHYSPEQRAVLQMRPGLTSLAQVVYRDEEVVLPDKDTEVFYLTEVMPRKLALDLFYVRNWSIALDFKVFLLGVFALLKVRPPVVLWPDGMPRATVEGPKGQGNGG